LTGAICAVFFVNLSFFLLWIDLLYAMVFGTKSGSSRSSSRSEKREGKQSKDKKAN
jgi:hypothetical protein